MYPASPKDHLQWTRMLSPPCSQARAGERRFAVRRSSVTPEPNTWDRVERLTPRNDHAHLLKLRQPNCSWETIIAKENKSRGNNRRDDGTNSAPSGTVLASSPGLIIKGLRGCRIPRRQCRFPQRLQAIMQPCVAIETQLPSMFPMAPLLVRG
jgi:hypothetical protein